ncbi:MAG: hypothetical protein IPO77_01615 [Acidobacteria bacterium]|nr:hypothetical protein [Acidobacteriota bacterium]
MKIIIWSSNEQPGIIQIREISVVGRGGGKARGGGPSGLPVEPGLKEVVAGTRYQFERLGYFCVDRDSTPGKPVFNRTIGLRDTWARIEQRENK